jgi:hypothetical protein
MKKVTKPVNIKLSAHLAEAIQEPFLEIEPEMAEALERACGASGTTPSEYIDRVLIRFIRQEIAGPMTQK